METDEKKPFVKPACMTAKRKTTEEQKMTCESLLFGDEAVRDLKLFLASDVFYFTFFRFSKSLFKKRMRSIFLRKRKSNFCSSNFLNPYPPRSLKVMAKR